MRFNRRCYRLGYLVGVAAMSAADRRETALAALLAGDLADVQTLADQNPHAVPDYVRRLVAAWEGEAVTVGAYDPATTPLTVAAKKHAAARALKARAEAMRRRFPNAFYEGDRQAGEHAGISEAQKNE